MKVKNIFIIIIILIMIVCLVILVKPYFKVSKEDLEEEYGEVTEVKLGVVSKASSNKVIISNNNVYINDGGVYNFKGILVNGTIYIDTDEDVTMNFSGVTLVNEDASVIDNRKSGKLIINLDENTNNILSDGSNSLAAIKSVGDIFLEGDGDLLIYANGGSGINVSSGSLVINSGSVYVIAKKEAFNINGEFLINKGTVLGLGNGNMQTTSSMSKQNTLLLNFEEVNEEATNFVLTDMDYQELISFEALRDFKTLTLSIPKLDEGRYRIFKNNWCSEEKINGIYEECEINKDGLVSIGINDAFVIDNKWNWYGDLDIIINRVSEIIS